MNPENKHTIKKSLTVTRNSDGAVTMDCNLTLGEMKTKHVVMQEIAEVEALLASLKGQLAVIEANAA